LGELAPLICAECGTVSDSLAQGWWALPWPQQQRLQRAKQRQPSTRTEPAQRQPPTTPHPTSTPRRPHAS